MTSFRDGSYTQHVFHGRRLAVLLGALALATGTAAASVAPTLTGNLSGMTKDELGRAIAGVEVVVLSNTPEGGALGRVVSNAQGRFLVAALAPGVYRIAAIKPGYLASIGRVNTLVRGSVDVILRPVPAPGEAGSEKVAPDLSWVLRLPPRSILQDLGAVSALDEHESGGVRAFAARMQDKLTGQVDHVVALGSWRPDGAESSSSLEGAETRMRLGGSLGERGAITVVGARGTLDADSQAQAPSVSRDAANVGVNVSYDTSDDASLAMSAYYARGDLEVGASAEAPKGGRQGQRSWGYDAQWQKQVDASSQVAVNVGYHDASLAVDGLSLLDWARAEDATNRALAAQGTYEASAADHHVMRFGVRAHRLDQSSPDVRFVRAAGPGMPDGTAGWSILLDGEDRWSPGGPVTMAYGLAVRQGIDGGVMGTTVTPRVAASWSGRRLKATGEVSYVSMLGTEPEEVAPLGYDVQIEAPFGTTVRGFASASYVPILADRWHGAPGIDAGVFVTDGRASDRVVSLGVERTAPSVAVSFQVAQGRAEGALAPAIDDGLPFVILSERAIDYDAARLGTRVPRSGSAIAVEYRALRGDAFFSTVAHGTEFKTVTVEFTQDLVRLGGGRATCRLLLAARTAFDVEDALAGGITPGEARRFAALQQRINAGVSLAF